MESIESVYNFSKNLFTDCKPIKTGKLKLDFWVIALDFSCVNVRVKMLNFLYANDKKESRTP